MHIDDRRGGTDPRRQKRGIQLKRRIGLKRGIRQKRGIQEERKRFRRLVYYLLYFRVCEVRQVEY